MKMVSYLRKTRRRLNMPKDLKDRVMADFASSLELRLENGQSWQAILTELGTPSQAAKELNTQMEEYTYRKSPWRWLCLGLAVFSGLCIAYEGLAGLLLVLFNKAYNAASIGVIGGADGPTAIFVTTAASDRFIPSMGIYILLLAMGIVGFFALSKLKRN